MTWDKLAYLPEYSLWRAMFKRLSFEIPGGPDQPSEDGLRLAEDVATDFDAFDQSARSLLGVSVRSGAEWTIADAIIDGGIVTPSDSWDAEFVLKYFVPDYVSLYVGFRTRRPLYVLQRIE